MEYFSEVYGNYYRAVAAVLAAASAKPLTESEISEIISQTAFGESAFYITPALLSGRWPLLRSENGLYYPVTKHDIRLPMTSLQRAWLAAMLEDARCSAFFTDSERQEITQALGTEPLYEGHHLRTVDACADGDAYADPGYRERLLAIIDAIRSRKILRISYTGGSGSRIAGDFLPFRLEYSAKDDKLRLHSVRIRYGRAIFSSVLNLGRIESVLPSQEKYRGDVGAIDYDAMKRNTSRNEPAVIELTDRRNALERFMVQFASYDKRTRRVDDTDKYICTINYDLADETELLIRLLSFGVTVKVLSPRRLADQMRERINRQRELMGQ